MSRWNNRRLYDIVTAVLLAKTVGLLVQNLWAVWRKPLYFDDAYMFARYAMNVRHGLGVSWNLDGVHTYGQTSLLWGFVVLLLSFLPVAVWKMLTIGSWLCSIGAMVAMAWAVAHNAKSELLRSTWRVLPWVALPLAETSIFNGNAGNGMETMLGALLCAVFVGLALLWSRGSAKPEMVALAGLVLFLARPDAVVVVLMLPLMLFLLMPGVSKAGVARLLGVFVVGVVLDLVLCKMYFHTALPLSFYMKSKHGYEGFKEVWHPELLMMAFFGACQLYLAAMVLLARRQDWRMIASFVVPMVVMFAYFGTVTQIMGFNARYYAPYFALVIVPAMLVIDRWFAAKDDVVQDRWPGKTLLVRGCVTGLMLVCFVALSSEGVQAKIRSVEARKHIEYDDVQYAMAAKMPLPVLPWDTAMLDVTDKLIAPLGPGITVAATEVGYLGRFAPQDDVIDMAGLNDNEIALHGFDVKALLARKPDVIWMPNTDYTYQRGLMISDPEFLQEYELYAGAANYGIAVRKDSSRRKDIEAQMKVFWSAAYPGLEMDDYVVTSAGWSGQKHVVGE
jgi:hypothetical protein